jgi:hypothetical protein
MDVVDPVQRNSGKAVEGPAGYAPYGARFGMQGAPGVYGI